VLDEADAAVDALRHLGGVKDDSPATRVFRPLHEENGEATGDAAAARSRQHALAKSAATPGGPASET